MLTDTPERSFGVRQFVRSLAKNRKAVAPASLFQPGKPR
jgi:hypothetical protein